MEIVILHYYIQNAVARFYGIHLINRNGNSFKCKWTFDMTRPYTIGIDIIIADYHYYYCYFFYLYIGIYIYEYIHMWMWIREAAVENNDDDDDYRLANAINNDNLSHSKSATKIIE